MAEQRVRNSGKKSSALRDAAALTTQLAAGLEKIGLAMKSRTWRREGRAGLGPLQRQVLTLLRSKPGQRSDNADWPARGNQKLKDAMCIQNVRQTVQQRFITNSTQRRT